MSRNRPSPSRPPQNPVSFEVADGYAVITLDDGRVNAFSPAMIAAVWDAFDRARAAGLPVLVRGRPGVLSAGFDLKIMKKGNAETIRMVLGGFRLAARVMAHPHPVVMVCTGHAVAMGCFFLLAADERIGVRGPYRIVANEVAIGITVPHTGVELCRARLSPAHFHRAVALSQAYDPEGAVAAGFLDAVVDADELDEYAQERIAWATGELHARSHRRTKHRSRGRLVRRLRACVRWDAVDLVVEGGRMMAGAGRSSRRTA